LKTTDKKGLAVTIECPKCHSENPGTKQFCADCGTQLPSSQDIHPYLTDTLQAPVHELTTGTTFAGRYQIIEELGKGGMGKVYRVLDKKLNEEVALKLIKPEIASDRETIERFSNELKLARRISHRNVGRMYELMEAEGMHFITMEYVPGQDLRGLIRQTGQLTTGKAVSIARQVCEGLSEAHGLGVVHRDLKPGNILIDRDGNAKIMDFGIARSISAKAITGAGVLIGTPEYMSPEQVEGKNVDQRSDIYSLGVILYQMLTGRVPFEGDTPLSVAVKQKTEAPKDPRTLNAQIPEDLDRLILRCLEKDIEKRYRTAAEIVSDLDKIEKGLPTTERIVPERKTRTSREITVKLNLKKGLIPVLVGAALVITAAIIIWRVVPRKGVPTVDSAKHSIAVLPFEDLSPKTDYRYLCDGIPEALINALNSLGDVRVPGRTSAFSFTGKGYGASEIGQKLNVETVLEGSVQVVDNNLQVTARLINVKDGYQLWSDRYSRILQDIYIIQDDIAQAIVKALKIKLLGGDEVPLVKRYTENSEAYDLYLQGRYFFNRRRESDIKKGIEYFEQAIAMDSKFALAYSGLADSYATLPDYSMFPPEIAYQEGKKAALLAVELDDGLAEAHTSLGEVLTHDYDWKKVEVEFRKAISLNPNYPQAHLWFGMSLMFQARHDEAIAELKHALDLDPYSLIINRNLGTAYCHARRYDEALEQSKKTAEMDPNFGFTNFVMGWAYLNKGMFQEAEQALQKETAFPDQVRTAFVYGCYARMGDPEKLKKYLEQNIRTLAIVSPFWVASWYAELRETDKVFEWLDKAYEKPDGWLLYLKVSSSFDYLRSDPRYKAMLKKIGLD
jgi:serine/threonine-protein kinase